jgi:hypothetical protein
VRREQLPRLLIEQPGVVTLVLCLWVLTPMALLVHGIILEYFCVRVCCWVWETGTCRDWTLEDQVPGGAFGKHWYDELGMKLLLADCGMIGLYCG